MATMEKWAQKYKAYKQFVDNIPLYFGDDQDASMQWNGSLLAIVGAARITGALTQIGNVGITGTLTVSGILSVDDTTASTSTVTGSIHTDGGLGVAGTSFFGGLLTADGGIDIGTVATGIDFTGTYTGNVIDFSNSTHVPTGSNGPCLIRAGTYAVPITNTSEDQSGLMRLYMSTSADGSSYDRGVFSCLKTSGTKGIFPVSGLAEVLAQSGAGPAQVGASQFIAHLFTSTSKVATRGTAGTANFYGSWLKVTSAVGSEASSGSVVAPVWLDNQMNGTVSGEEYAAYITSGTLVDAVFGFEGTGGGRWNHLFYFDSTCAALTPFVSTGCTIATGDTPYLKVLMNATEYGIPLITI